MANKLYELIEEVNKSASEHGHILGDWTTYGGSHRSYYGGHSSDTDGYAHCQLCKQNFAIDSKNFSIEISQCQMNLNGYLKVDESIDGLGVVT